MAKLHELKSLILSTWKFNQYLGVRHWSRSLGVNNEPKKKIRWVPICMDMAVAEEKDNHTVTHINVNGNCGKHMTLLPHLGGQDISSRSKTSVEV